MKKRKCTVNPKTLLWAIAGIPGALTLLEGSSSTGAPPWRVWAPAGASLACARRSKMCVEPQAACGTHYVANNMHTCNFHRDISPYECHKKVVTNILCVTDVLQLHFSIKNMRCDVFVLLLTFLNNNGRMRFS